MKKFDEANREKIQKVKDYLKEIRQLNIKTSHLLFTKSNAEFHSMNFKNIKKTDEMKYIDIQIEECQKELSKFVSKVYILDNDEMEIISIYIAANSYKEMVERLNERGIAEHVYTSKIPYICLKLSPLIEDNDFGCVQRANNEYIKKITGA